MTSASPSSKRISRALIANLPFAPELVEGLFLCPARPLEERKGIGQGRLSVRRLGPTRALEREFRPHQAAQGIANQETAFEIGKRQFGLAGLALLDQRPPRHSR